MTMKQTTITVPDELEEALLAFQRDQAVPLSLDAIAKAALREYLAGRGYLTSSRVLEITPAPYGSGERTVSVDHDRFFTQEKE